MRRLLLAAIAATPVGFATSAYADTFSWTAPLQDSWLNPAAWLNASATNGVPGASDTGVIDNGGSSIIDTAATVNVGTLNLGELAGNSGTMKVSAGTFLDGSTLRVGGNTNGTAGGVGTFLQTGATVVGATTLYIGSSNISTVASSAAGTYSLGADSLGFSGALAIGTGGILVGNGSLTTGTFLQSAGSLTTGTIVLGSLDSSGSFLMSGGTLSTTGIILGGTGGSTANGKGYFLQDNNGTVNVTGAGGNVFVGIGTFGGAGAPKSQGTYTMNSGTLAVGGQFILGRNSGAGTFLLSGLTNPSTITLTKDFFDGGEATTTVTGTGWFDQSAGTTFNQTVSGDAAATYGFNVGIGASGATGTYLMHGGALNITKGTPTAGGLPAAVADVQETMAIGNGTGKASFIQSGGVVNVSNAVISVGRQASNGTYTISGNSQLTLSGPDSYNGTAVSNDLWIGGQSGGNFASAGTFSQSAGTTVTIANGSVTLGISSQVASTAAGTYLMSGGTLIVSRAASELVVGQNGTGFFSQSDGTVTLSSTGLVDIGRANNGTYTMTGGTLTAGAVTMGASGASTVFKTFNLSGGSVSIGSINMTNSTSTAIRNFNANSGTLIVSRMTVGQSGSINLNGASVTTSSISFFGGTLAASTNNNLGSAIVDVSTPGASNPGGGTILVSNAANTLSLGGLTYNASLGLTKSGPGTVAFTGAITRSSTAIASSLTDSAGVVKLAAPAQTVNVLGALAITGGSGTAVDMTNNNLVLDYTGAGNSPLASVRTALTSGYAGGAWNGQGINSSSAAAAASSANKTAIGYSEASALGLSSFAGTPVDSDAVVLRYVYSGDSNLDGVVNALDFNSLATNYGSSSPNWVQGDYNYDGTVNSSDFALLAANFGIATPASADPLAAPASFALGSLVPEPVSMRMLAFSGLTLMRRRRGL